MTPQNAARPVTTSAKVDRPRENVLAARFDFPSFTLPSIADQENLAAHILAARYRLPLDRAVLIADLAGFGGRAA
jgi:hypothetical protein